MPQLVNVCYVVRSRALQHALPILVLYLGAHFFFVQLLLGPGEEEKKTSVIGMRARAKGFSLFIMARTTECFTQNLSKCCYE